MNKTKLIRLLSSALVGGTIGLTASQVAAADPVCQAEYERLFKTFTGDTAPGAKYCTDTCAVSKSKISDEQMSFMLDCEKLIAGRWNGGPIGATAPGVPATSFTRSGSVQEQRQANNRMAPAPARVSMSATEGRKDPYRLGDPTTPNSQFPYPVIAKGEIWVPDLKWQNLTTIVNVPLWDDRHKERPTLPLPYEDMLKANRGAELIRLLEAYAPGSQAGRAEYDIYSIYNKGLGGVPKNEAKAWEWMNKTAKKHPGMYYYIGVAHRDGTYGQGKNPLMAAHYWSVGLSRGCRLCGERLVRWNWYPPKGVTLPFDDDTYFRYMMFTYDLGEFGVDNQISSYEMSGKAKTPEKKAFYNRVSEISGYPQTGSGGYRPAGQVKTSDEYFWSSIGTAIAVRERYRTGLVHEHLLKTYKNHKTAHWEKTARGLVNYDSFGRYRGAAISEFLAYDAKKAKPEVFATMSTYLAREAVDAGAVSNAPLAALTYAGQTSYTGYGKKLEKKKFDPSLYKTRYYMDLAVKAGLATNQDSENMQAMAAMSVADKCWEDASTNSEWGSSNIKDWSVRQAQNVMIGVRKFKCFDKTAMAEVMTGERYPIPDYVAKYTQINQQVSAQTRAARERLQAKEDARRAAWASSNSSKPNSYIANGSSNSAPGATVSSSEAYRQSKARVCASSTTKTRFCR